MRFLEIWRASPREDSDCLERSTRIVTQNGDDPDADGRPVVVELEVGFGLERDREVEREVAVRRLREAKDGAPIVQVALQRDDLAGELVALEVVGRLPLRRPLRA